MSLIFAWKLFQTVGISKIFDTKMCTIGQTCYQMDIFTYRLLHCATLQGKKQNGKILKLFTFGEIAMAQNDYLLVIAAERYETCRYLQRSKQLTRLYQLHPLLLRMVLIKMLFVMVLYNQDIMHIDDRVTFLLRHNEYIIDHFMLLEM